MTAIDPTQSGLARSSDEAVTNYSTDGIVKQAL
jgi:hypothetical protein